MTNNPNDYTDEDIASLTKEIEKEQFADLVSEVLAIHQHKIDELETIVGDLLSILELTYKGETLH